MIKTFICHICKNAKTEYYLHNAAMSNLNEFSVEEEKDS